MAQITLNSSGVASNGSLLLQSNGTTTAVTIDTAQNMGLGVTPSAWTAAYRAFDFGGYGNLFSNSTDKEVALTYNAAVVSGTGWTYKNTNQASLYNQQNGKHVWQTAASGTAGTSISWTTPMTLDASGNLLVGTTSGPVTARGTFNYPGNTTIGLVIQDTTAAGGTAIRFYTNSTGFVGSITTSASATAFNTSSDYRLKENVAPMTGALAKVLELNPVTYTWKSDGSDGQGFIAHELAEVCPQAVSGEKDAVNEDGSIKPQGIDTSFLVATLTAAIQEQQAIIQTLTDRITALEQA